jgi:hypothetical protein
MKTMGEALYREPNPEQAETMRHVLELASSWQRGGLGLDSLRRQCSGYDRFTAMRFTPPGTEDRALMRALLEALVAEEQR